MIDQQSVVIIDALNQLEVGLRDLGLWSDERPTAEALASTLPFCYDTLDLEQWLQFVFLGRFLTLLNSHQQQLSLKFLTFLDSTLN